MALNVSLVIGLSQMDPGPDLSPHPAGWSLTVNRSEHCHCPDPAPVLLDHALATPVPTATCVAATLSSKLVFPCATAPVLLLPGSCVGSSSEKLKEADSPQMLWNATWRHWCLYSEANGAYGDKEPCFNLTFTPQKHEWQGQNLSIKYISSLSLQQQLDKLWTKNVY